MYIEKLVVRNFRLYGEKETQFSFNPKMNVIVGENNVGKTSLIDALRLVLSIGKYKRDVFVEPEDFHVNECGKSADSIIFDVYFSELNEDQKVLLSTALDSAQIKAVIRICYSKKKIENSYRIAESITSLAGAQVEKEALATLFNYVYMPALRNASQTLRPSSSSQLARLAKSYSKDPSKRETLEEEITEINKRISVLKAVKDLNNAIDRSLGQVEKTKIKQEITLTESGMDEDSFGESLSLCIGRKSTVFRGKKETFLEKISEQEFLQIEPILKCSDGVYSVDANAIMTDTTLTPIAEKIFPKDFFSIGQNGLGYNNMLSMAAALAELSFSSTENHLYQALLIEEPEAHLHPQMLALINDFLDEEEGQTQIFVTSHSPGFVSKCPLDRILILRRQGYTIQTQPLSSLSEKLISDEKQQEERKNQLNYLQRFLDVTKSQIFFSRGVLFVEGVSETLLMKTLAKRINIDLDECQIEVCNINGVCFSPFITLIKGLGIPCAVITDDDRKVTDFLPTNLAALSDETVRKALIELQNSPISDRANILKTTVENCPNIQLNLAEKTFEYELALPKENRAILMEILKKIHPTIHTKYSTLLTDETPNKTFALLFWIGIKNEKADFAQELSLSLQKNQTVFTVPTYIVNALKFVTKR